MTQTSYFYSAQNYFSNSTIYNMIFKNSTSTSSNKSNYWVASRCVFLNANYCNFSVCRVNGGGLDSGGSMYYSNGTNNSPAYRAVPIVLLETNIQTTGQDANGVWQLKVD